MLLGRMVESGRVWLRRGWLDERLAAGASPGESPDLRRRADQLRSRRHRRELAESLVRLVEAAERPTPPSSAAVPVRRRAVLAARTELVELALDLGATSIAPDVRGIALVERLLRDGGSPVYARSGGRSVKRAVLHAHARLLGEPLRQA